jgi:hypothetical protein
MPRVKGSPTAEQIRTTREALGLTRTQAATLIDASYYDWWRYEAGGRRMSSVRWKLFKLKSAMRAHKVLAGRPVDKRERTRPAPKFHPPPAEKPLTKTQQDKARARDAYQAIKLETHRRLLGLPPIDPTKDTTT